MSDKLKWGILGTGMIANKFATDLPQSKNGELVATGSRTQASADAFSTEYGGKGHASYDSLLADPNVDVVYNSLPNGMHHEWTIKALEAGKHVLCEKPFAANLNEADEMFQAAERTGKVLVEAFMYRSHPGINQLLGLLKEGVIGDIRIARANFTFCREVDDNDARYHPSQAGGALMDVGCYCFNFLRAVLGNEPESINTIAHLHPMGVDDYAAGTLRFPGDILATFTCGMTVFNNWQCTLGGTKGYIEIDNPWFGCESFKVVDENENETVYDNPSEKGLYAYEADAMAEAILGGKRAWITQEDTLGNIRLLDEARRQIFTMV